MLVLLCCLVLPLHSGQPARQVLLYIFFYAVLQVDILMSSIVFYTVLQTWVRLYYTAVARKQATLSKYKWDGL